MPHEGLPVCVHDSIEDVNNDIPDSRCPDQFWLIKQTKPHCGWIPLKRLIECKHCGKQRWTSTQRIYGTLDPKPQKESKDATKKEGS